MNTTRPPSPCSTSRLPTALLNRNAPVRCVSSTLLQSSAESSSTGALMLLPAQCTRKSTLPKWSIVRCTAASTEGSEATWTSIPIALPPRSVTSAAVASARVPSTSATATPTPASAKARHTAEPMPPAPPVTMATLHFIAVLLAWLRRNIRRPATASQSRQCACDFRKAVPSQGHGRGLQTRPYPGALACTIVPMSTVIFLARQGWLRSPEPDSPGYLVNGRTGRGASRDGRAGPQRTVAGK